MLFSTPSIHPLLLFIIIKKSFHLLGVEWSTALNVPAVGENENREYLQR
jgi:hypothetical protein